MVYRFIQTHQKEFGLRWLLRKCGIYPNAYYNFIKNRKAAYHQQKERILQAIHAIYHQYNGIPGHRQMQYFLNKEGIKLSKTTVFCYMNQESQLHSIARRRKPHYHKGNHHDAFSNIIKQEFRVSHPARVWCIDFTYLPLSNGSMRFNCTIIDLYHRGVVASITGRSADTTLAIQTLEKALGGHLKRGLILHSDQGSPFTSAEFRSYCQAKGIVQSMSRAGCPYDNAPMERYFNTLKNELIYHNCFHTEQQLYHAVNDFAYLWYNLVRPHSFNDGLPPGHVQPPSF